MNIDDNRQVLDQNDINISKADNIEDDASFTINELRVIENLSVRAYNVCHHSNLNNLKNIIDFFGKNKSFKKLRNCGDKANDELIKLSKKYKNHLPQTENIDLEYEITIQKLNQKFQVNISDFIESFKDGYKNNNLSIFKIIDIVLRNGNYLDKIEKEIIKNLYGKEKSKLEDIASRTGLSRERIRQKKDKLTARIFQSHSPIRYLIELFNDQIDKSNFNFSEELIIIDNEIIEKINKASDTNFSVFLITKILSLLFVDYNFINQSFSKVPLRKSVFIEAKKQEILKNNYLLKNCFNVNSIIKFIDYFKDLTICKRDSDFIINKHDILNNSVNDYKKDYSKLINDIAFFIAERNNDYELLRKELLENIYVLLGNKVSQGIYSNIGEIYISKHLKFTKKNIRQINFNDLLNYDWTCNSERNNLIRQAVEEYRGKIENIKLICGKKVAEEREKIKSKYSQYFNMFKIIANKEFDLQLDNNFILFKRNTPKQKHEFIFDVLNKFNRPMHVSELFAEISNINSDLFPDEQSIRNTCLKKEGIICFSRTSTYGLKRWEKEKENIKGGSIRKIVEEYLSNKKTPKHIDEITNYVNQYRNTNSKSVLYNLKLIKSKLFEFHEGGFVSLSKKNNVQ